MGVDVVARLDELVIGVVTAVVGDPNPYGTSDNCPSVPAAADPPPPPAPMPVGEDVFRLSSRFFVFVVEVDPVGDENADTLDANGVVGAAAAGAAEVVPSPD